MEAESGGRFGARFSFGRDLIPNCIDDRGLPVVMTLIDDLTAAVGC